MNVVVTAAKTTMPMPIETSNSIRVNPPAFRFSEHFMQFAYCARIVCKFTDRAALFASFQLTVTETVFKLLAVVTNADCEKVTPPMEGLEGALPVSAPEAAAP